MELNVNGYTVLIDDKDAAELLGKCLRIGGHRSDRGRYACLRGERQHRTVHRELLAPAMGQQVDHINGNSLDNRRSNLRLCNQAQNTRNRKRGFSKSGYKGLKWNKPNGRWHATVRIDGRAVHCGTSVDPIKAAKKYDIAARKHHGEFARLNFSCDCGLETVCAECGTPSPWKK